MRNPPAPRLESITSVAWLIFALLVAPLHGAESGGKSARVTQIIHEVNLVPASAAPHAATVNDQVTEDTAVRTGNESRSELTFRDLTIDRLGANTIFTFNKAGRNSNLAGGSLLLRVPKDSGGAAVHNPAVTVAVTGTTLILEAARSGRSKLIVLEGNARLSLTKFPKQFRMVHGGEMLEVPAGATTLSDPVPADLDNVMSTHPLVAGFPPLPSRDLITAQQNAGTGGAPIYQGRPVTSGGTGIQLPPLLGLLPLPGGNRGGTRSKTQTTPTKPKRRPTPQSQDTIR